MSYFSDYGEAMYDAITQVLQKNGNDIFRMNINNPKFTNSAWGGVSQINNEELLQSIQDFNPDVVFSFNNSLPINCYDVLDKNCKICAIDADAPQVAFWNRNTMNHYFNRFVFLGLQSYSKTMYEKYLGKKLTDKNYLYFPPATIVKNKKLKQNKNISFIGSNFYPFSIPQGLDFYGPDALKLYDALKKNYFTTLDEAKKICKNTSNVAWLFEKVHGFYCGQDRLQHLQQLTDLGLTIYGVRRWNQIAYIDFELAKCFDKTPKTTIEENQWVYNTSKISVNFSHPLAKSSFSWRVMDIMASNSCLLMEDKPDWRDLFAKYLSPEVLDTIIYKDRFDMRQKAIKLLNDEELRKRCVAELNNAIEQNGRWESRFDSLGKFLGIKLLKNKNKEPIYIRIYREEPKPVEPVPASPVIKTKKKKSAFAKLKIKKRSKLFFYSLLLLIAQVPVLDLFIRSKKRKKILRKINKWWR